MTTFVRRIPAKFDALYWRTAPEYMERELGAVATEEAERHERPKGFVSAAGEISGQTKDQSYCFAPYDGLRGLGMTDVEAYEDDFEEEELGQMPMPKWPGAPVLPIGDAPSAGTDSSKGISLFQAAPYVLLALGVFWWMESGSEKKKPR